MAKSIIKNGNSEQHFDVVRASEASAELAEQQTLGFCNDREHAHVGVYKIWYGTDRCSTNTTFSGNSVTSPVSEFCQYGCTPVITLSMFLSILKSMRFLP